MPRKPIGGKLVRVIRERLEAGVPERQTARELGISRTTVRKYREDAQEVVPAKDAKPTFGHQPPPNVLFHVDGPTLNLEYICGAWERGWVPSDIAKVAARLNALGEEFCHRCGGHRARPLWAAAEKPSHLLYGALAGWTPSPCECRPDGWKRWAPPDPRIAPCEVCLGNGLAPGWVRGEMDPSLARAWLPIACPACGGWGRRPR